MLSSARGDVVLVPDGAKPLVLAMSLIPEYTGFRGVFCWHIGHVKPDGYVPNDVEATGEIVAFRLSDV